MRNKKTVLVALMIAMLTTAVIVAVVLLLNQERIFPTSADQEKNASEKGFTTGIEPGNVVQGNEPAGDMAQNDVSSASEMDDSENSGRLSSVDEFLKYDDFFSRGGKEELKTAENELSLIAVSVEKDLRVRVVNPNQETVTGEPFVLSVRNEGEYRDLDRDGVIFVGGLRAGEYEISLCELSGYEVPDSGMWVSVKDKVDYIALDDISYLIKTEDEVLAAEDHEARDLSEDADKTESETRLSDTNALPGIDVSKWNGKIDWDAVADDGIKYAVIRCAYRGYTTGSLVEDPNFLSNLQNASKAGIQVGIYFFSQAVTEAEAVEEASIALALAGDYRLDYPIYIDTESIGGKGRADSLEPAMRTAVCKAFCETIENSGRTAGVYACRNWLYNHLDVAELTEYSVWLAEYRSEPLYIGKYDMWQYSSRGTVAGIEGNVDLNLSYRKY